MKRLLVSFAIIASLVFGQAGPAVAAPNYGYRFTARHGWIVWADNDRIFPIRTRCHWFAGSYWHTRWLLMPNDYAWTTSDAGSWGDRRPRGLSCSYVRVYTGVD